MPRFGQSANLDTKLIEAAVEFYAQRLVQIPDPFRDLHAGLVVVALDLSARNWHRLEIIDKNTILVHNRPVW